MGEVDYQMALLLQYKLEQEHKHKENTDSDHKLALELQQQFTAEVEVERPANNLVYKAPKRADSSKCLTDPSWEIIDPTPDVHVLFEAFNQRFFWNNLNSVTVAWSKKMTTCAGICCYQGRGGMCSITLSEPLLKLRPRKDLVETLLHEMIHALLFVTNNNRDRDGHGPEFHKHMYRINKEAGTNITVYHDFHDEVKFYQQHWWRCDGPCQNRKPYFGMVRRATNRAPGAYDRWWDEHLRNCGGTFVKVKNPEATSDAEKSNKKIVKPTKPTNPKADIRSYITASSGSTNTQTKPSVSQPSKPITSTPQVNKPSTSTIKNPLPKNIQTISNNGASAPHVSNVIPSKTSNIFGFTNLSGNSSTPKRPAGGTAIKNPGSSTFVVTNKGRKTSSTETEQPSTSEIKPFSGQGKVLSSSSQDNTRDYSAVRDHWLKKFDKSNSPSNKRSSTSDYCSPPKLPRLSINNDVDKVECPVCSKKFIEGELNAHLDICLISSNSNENNSKECFVCGENISDTDYEKHVSDCAAKNFSSNFDDEEQPKNCPVCKKSLTPKEYDIHVEKCMLSMFEKFDKISDSPQSEPTTKTPCLACGKDILKTNLDAHLEECMGMSNVFDTSKVLIEEDDGENAVNRSYHCPFCLKLILEDSMQAHLDQCLKAGDLKFELSDTD
ncbi:unnamed protein product [Ceutorhynchus assimilis]|uniref:Protein with SprT-like domain at the N terminus n=1 Tax=Ceutorhynchus assimilis TaxID=467358 RepID=A0A9P0DG70_9CUCU|nr:unnamed protein product [Ceutorhynchus assimilis]